MIIEPDFPDHWKTQHLIKLTADPAAPMLILRFWAHCHTRKAWRFTDLTDVALAAICRWPKEPSELRRVLVEAGFLDVQPLEGGGVELVAHDFDQINGKLVSNWVNGRLSHGRPKTHAEPNGNPRVSDRLIDIQDRGDGLDGGDRDTPKAPASGGGRKRGSRSKPAGPSLTPSTQPEPKRGRMLALNAILRRPPTDAWNAVELAALESSGLLAMAELDFVDAAETVRAYYHATIPHEIQKRFWKRTTLVTLLEGWGGELDKARAWARERDDGIRPV